MGMDVIGYAPENEQGEYFRRNVWWWHLLWDFTIDVTDFDLDPDGEGHYNQGFFVDGDQAKRIARCLRLAVERGDALRFQQAIEKDNRKVEPNAITYFFNVESVVEFADFMDHSGGFSIY